MLDWAEVNVAAGGEGAGRELELVVFEYDASRQRLLAGREYAQKMDCGGMVRHMRLPCRGLPAAGASRRLPAG